MSVDESRKKVLASGTKTAEDRIAWLKQLPEEEKEGICVNCAACCMGAVNVVDTPVIMASLPCRFLEFNDGKSRCSVYPKRFEKAPWCNDTEGMIRKELAPSECPYVAGIEGYRGKKLLRGSDYVRVESLTRNHMRKMNPLLLKDLLAFARKDDVDKFLGAS